MLVSISFAIVAIWAPVTWPVRPIWATAPSTDVMADSSVAEVLKPRPDTGRDADRGHGA